MFLLHENLNIYTSSHFPKLCPVAIRMLANYENFIYPFVL